MRIMQAIQQSQLTAGGDAPQVRLIGRYQHPGRPARSRCRLRFEPSTVERSDFDDRDYLEAFDLADAAVIHRLPRAGPMGAERAGTWRRTAPVGSPAGQAGRPAAAGPAARGSPLGLQPVTWRR